MRALVAAAVLLAAQVAWPAAAQDRMSVEACAQGWSAATALAGIETAATFALDEAGWCAVEGALITLDSATELRVANLRWRATDLARFTSGGLPPRAVEVEAQGIAPLPRTGDPLLDYVLSVQAANSPIAARLSVRWDGVQNAVTLERAELSFDAANRIEVSGRIDGVNLTDLATIQSSAGTAGVQSLTVKAEFAGWFEDMVLMPFGFSVLDPDGPPPEQQVEALKAQAVVMLDALPEAVLPVPSRDALTAFIATLPAPRGNAQLQVSATPPFGMLRAMPFGLADGLPDAEAFEGISTLFTWTPREPQR